MTAVSFERTGFLKTDVGLEEQYFFAERLNDFLLFGNDGLEAGEQVALCSSFGSLQLGVHTSAFSH